MSDGQKRAWFDELKAEFPNLPDQFVRMAVDSFDKDPSVFNTAYRTERKRAERKAKSEPSQGHGQGQGGALTFAQLEERAEQFKVHLADIERHSKAYVVEDAAADVDLVQLKMEDSENTPVSVC